MQRICALRTLALNSALILALGGTGGAGEEDTGDTGESASVETPEDLGRRLRVRNGCITHIDMGLLRAGPLRPSG